MVAEVVRVALYDFGGYRCMAVEKLLQTKVIDPCLLP